MIIRLLRLYFSVLNDLACNPESVTRRLLYQSVKASNRLSTTHTEITVGKAITVNIHNTHNCEAVKMSEPKTKKFLLVFDFDHSLIDENSDEVVTHLAPGGQIPEEIKNLLADDFWTDYMAAIFKYLHGNGCTSENILSLISKIPLTEGMKELLDFTRTSGNFDHVIISDANSVFIQCILQDKGLSSMIDRVFTNPAEFDENGCLTIKRYHTQDWCTLSTVNLCKGHILDKYIEKRREEGVEYQQVVYVGDGYNDLCPGLSLRPNDTLMPRVGFKLEKLLGKMARKNKPVPRSQLKANVVPWETGLNILTYIKSLGS